MIFSMMCSLPHAYVPDILLQKTIKEHTGAFMMDHYTVGLRPMCSVKIHLNYFSISY